MKRRAIFFDHEKDRLIRRGKKPRLTFERGVTIVTIIEWIRYLISNLALSFIIPLSFILTLLIGYLNRDFKFVPVKGEDITDLFAEFRTPPKPKPPEPQAKPPELAPEAEPVLVPEEPVKIEPAVEEPPPTTPNKPENAMEDYSDTGMSAPNAKPYDRVSFNKDSDQREYDKNLFTIPSSMGAPSSSRSVRLNGADQSVGDLEVVPGQGEISAPSISNPSLPNPGINGDDSIGIHADLKGLNDGAGIDVPSSGRGSLAESGTVGAVGGQFSVGSDTVSFSDNGFQAPGRVSRGHESSALVENNPTTAIPETGITVSSIYITNEIFERYIKGVQPFYENAISQIRDIENKYIKIQNSKIFILHDNIYFQLEIFEAANKVKITPIQSGYPLPEEDIEKADLMKYLVFNLCKGLGVGTPPLN